MKTVLKSYWNPTEIMLWRLGGKLTWPWDGRGKLQRSWRPLETPYFIFIIFIHRSRVLSNRISIWGLSSEIWLDIFLPLPSGGQKSAKSAKSIEIPWFLSGRGTFAEPSALSEYQKVRKIQTLNRDANGAKKCNTFYCLIAENGALKAKHENPDFWPDFPKKLS